MTAPDPSVTRPPRRVSLDRPPTLDEYRQWEATATRHATDEPIGRDGTRRHADARNSEIISARPPSASAAARQRAHRTRIHDQEARP